LQKILAIAIESADGRQDAARLARRG